MKKYVADEYGSVFELTKDRIGPAYVFIGVLGGRTLEQWLLEREESEEREYLNSDDAQY